MVHFDFEFLLLILTAVTGVIWLADVLLLARLRQQPATGKIKKEPLVIEYSRAFFPVLIAVLVLRAFLFEPFRIPSGSMMPTLLVGDFILVNKFTYGLRMPVWQTRITGGSKPKRGDVVVFRYPQDESQDYIKRVVGLPGDRISYYNKMIYVNGELVQQKSLGVYTGQGSGVVMTGASLRTEMLGDIGHQILVMGGRPKIERDFVVPEGNYFVMGDNRDHSSDSRSWGFVPEENLVGRAFLVWMNWDFSGKKFNFKRIGKKII